MKTVYVIDNTTHIVRKNRSVREAHIETGIAMPTIEKYMDKDKVFKGYRFMSNENYVGVHNLRYIGTAYKMLYDISWMSVEQRADFRILRDFVILNNDTDVQRLFAVLRLPENRRESFRHSLIMADSRKALSDLDERLKTVDNTFEAIKQNEVFMTMGVKTSSGVRYGSEVSSFFTGKKGNRA